MRLPGSLRKLLRYVQIYGPARTLEKALSRSSRGWPKLYRRRGPRDLALIGCGQFGWSTICHYLARAGGNRFAWCYDPDTTRAHALARRFGFRQVVADPWQVLKLEDAGVRTVVVASNHASHAPYAVAALRAGKGVYTEKPVAVTRDQLADLEAARRAGGGPLFVGYNRPFAPAVRFLERFIDPAGETPMTLSCTVAGHVLSADHWYRRPEEGTRICGNVGHWLDLAVHLLRRSGGLADRWDLSLNPSDPAERDENVTLVLSSERGDLITIVLTARSEPFEGIRETIVFQQGDVQAEIADFRTITVWKGARRVHRRYWPKDVGHRAAVAQLFDGAGAWQDRWQGVLRSSLWMLDMTDMVRSDVRHRRFSFAERLADLETAATRRGEDGAEKDR